MTEERRKEGKSIHREKEKDVFVDKGTERKVAKKKKYKEDGWDDGSERVKEGGKLKVKKVLN